MALVKAPFTWPNSVDSSSEASGRARFRVERPQSGGGLVLASQPIIPPAPKKLRYCSVRGALHVFGAFVFNILLFPKFTCPAPRPKLSGGVLYSPVPAIYYDLLISSFIFLAVASGVAVTFKHSYQGIDRIAQRKTWGPICAVSSSRPPPAIDISEGVGDAIVGVSGVAFFGIVGSSESGKRRFEVLNRRHLL